jgi:hypothetical protein
MRIFLFSIYYLKLRAGAALGIYPTHGPLNIRWRWETWHRLRKAERKYATPGTFSHLRNDVVRLWKIIMS